MSIIQQQTNASNLIQHTQQSNSANLSRSSTPSSTSNNNSINNPQQTNSNNLSSNNSNLAQLTTINQIQTPQPSLTPTAIHHSSHQNWYTNTPHYSSTPIPHHSLNIPANLIANPNTGSIHNSIHNSIAQANHPLNPAYSQAIAFSAYSTPAGYVHPSGLMPATHWQTTQNPYIYGNLFKNLFKNKNNIYYHIIRTDSYYAGSF